MKVGRKTVALLLSLLLAFVLCGCNKSGTEKLASPQDLRYESGVVTWTAVPRAQSYLVSVRRDDAAPTESETDKTSFAVEAAGAYTVSVTAKSGTLVSEPAALHFIVVDALPAPAHVVYDGGQLRWDPCAEATGGFAVTVRRADGTTVIEETVNTPSIDVRGLPQGDYTALLAANEVVNYFAASKQTVKEFTVKATESSQPSQKMPAVTGLKYDAQADTLSWDVVEGNNGYVAEVYRGDVRVLFSDDLTEHVALSTLALGEYTARVVVSGDGEKFGDSQAAALSFSIASRGTLTSPAGLNIENGFLKWTAQPFVRDTRITVRNYTTREEVTASPVFDGDNALFLTDLGVANGLYTVSVSLLSNRYDNAESEPSHKDVSIEVAAEFDARQIASFSGSQPYGEHGAVDMVHVNGTAYAEVRPTADGWGRVASPAFRLDFDKNPICFMEVGYVFGGYHLQLQTDDLNFDIIRDTNRLGNANGDLTAATGLTGVVSAVRLRIGVNSSTTEAANDARVRYSKLRVGYVSEIVPPDPQKLDAVRNMQVRDGEVLWESPQNDAFVTAYRVRVTNAAGDEADTQTLHTTSYNAAALPDGRYTLSVTACNELFPDLITPSDEVTYQIRVSSAVRYTAQQLDTETGDFVSLAQGAPNDVQAQFNGTLTEFNSTNVTGWGYIGPKNGVTVDMDRNPIGVLRTAGAQGGYFLKATYTGSNGVRDVVGNVSVQYDGDRALTVKLNEPMGEHLGGVKNDYKLMPGCLAAVDSDYRTVCKILLYGIDIVYVEEYIEAVVPDVPVALPAPENFRLDGTLLCADTVKGNSEYRPVYDIALQADGETIAERHGEASPQIDLSYFDLRENTDYTVTVQAKGDGVYFADSPAVTQTVRMTAVASITDFTDVTVQRRESNITVVSKGADGLTYAVPSGAWGLLAFALPVNGSLDGARLFIEYGDITGGSAMMAGRYYHGASGTGYTYNLGGDHLVTSGSTVSYGALENARITDGNLYLGVGMGGGSGERQITIKSVKILTWHLVG